MPRPSTCSPPRPRAQRAIAANIIDFESFRPLHRMTWAATRPAHTWRHNQLAVLPLGILESSPFRRVVAFARQDLQILLGGFHLDLAELSIRPRVCGIVAQRILAAQLLRNLVKGF